MATQYPTSFPKPLIRGYRIFLDAGVIRADNPGQQVQRRVYDTLPATISLSFAMSVEVWTPWQQWVSANAFRWFQILLPTGAAALIDAIEAPTVIRFVSPILASNITEDDVEVSVTAERSPSMYSTFLENQ